MAAKTVIGSSGLTYDRVRAILWYDSSSTNTTVTYGLAVGGHGYGTYSTSAALSTSLSCSGQTTHTTSGQGGDFSSGTDVWLNPTSGVWYYKFNRTTKAQTKTIYFSLTSTGSTISGTSSGSLTVTIPALPTYTVKYNANGGTGAPSSQTKTYGKTLTLSKTKPTYTGHTFSHWDTKSDGSGTNYSPGGSYTANAAATLYARWTTNSYTLTYNANGGICSTTSKSVAYGSTYGTLPSATRTGYTFKGWYTAASGGSQVTSSTKMGAANTTIYAQWTANTVTITFNANGGTQGISEYTLPFTRTVAYNNDINLTNHSTFALTKTGYSAKPNEEWNTKADGTGTSYHQDPEYSWSTFGSTSASTKSVSLYANWQINSYTLTYDANGGEVFPTSKTVVYNSAYGELPRPTRAHYNFDGWFTATVGGEEVSDATIMHAADTTIYAHWTLMDFTVTINPSGGRYNGSTNPTEVTTISGFSDNNEIGVASRIGYVFQGWYDSNVTQIFDINGNAIPGTDYWSNDVDPVWIGMNDLTVYAHWQAKPPFEDEEYTYTIIDTASVRARVKDKTKTEYSNLESTVENDGYTYTIVSLDDCYANCQQLEVAPIIPNTVTSMSNCFAGCKELDPMPDIPYLVTNMSYCFAGCEKLTNININSIPNSVIDMFHCFDGCIRLHTAPKLPEAAIMLEGCFYGCFYLTGDIFVGPAAVVNYDDIFEGAATLEGHHLYIIPYDSDVPHDIWQNIANEYDNVTYLGIDSEYQYTAIDLDSCELNVQVLNRTKTTYDSFKTTLQAKELWTVTSIDNCYKNCTLLDDTMVFMTGFDSYVDAFTNVSNVKIVYVGTDYYDSWSTIVSEFPNVSFVTSSDHFEFEYEDYTYNHTSGVNLILEATVNSNKTSYSELISQFTINNNIYTLESLFGCFANTNIETSPIIPASVEIMADCFANCRNLQGNIIVLNAPNNVADCEGVFYNTDNDIYIINGYNHTRTSGTDVANSWRAIINAEQYDNVHYEVDDLDIPGVLTANRSYYTSGNISCGNYVGQYLSSSFSALKSNIINLPNNWSVNLHTNDQNYTTVEQMGSTIINDNINIISTNTEFSFTDPNRIFRVNNHNITLIVYYDIKDNNQAVVTTKEKTYNFEPDWLNKEIIPVDSFDSDYIYTLGNNNEVYAYAYDKTKESYNQWNANVTHLNYPVYGSDGVLLTNRIGCFEGCQYLKGNIVVSSNIADATNAFNNTDPTNHIFIINDGTADATTWINIAENWDNVHFEGVDNKAPTIIRLKVDRGTYAGGIWDEDDAGTWICVEPNVSISNQPVPSGWVSNYNYLKDFSILYRDNILNNFIVTSESYRKLNTKTWDNSITYYVENNNQYVIADPQPSSQQDFNNNYDNYYVKCYDPTETKIYFQDSQETQANLTLTVYDFYGHSQNQTAIVYQVFAMLDFIPGGQGMAIGKVGYRNGLDISIPTAIGEGLELPRQLNYELTQDSTINENKTYYELIDGEYVKVTNPVIEDIASYYEATYINNTVDLNNYQLVIGKYNKSNEGATFIVGNGNINTRSNLMEVGEDLITIGNKDKVYTELDENGQRFYQSNNNNNNNNLIANIGYGEGQSTSGTAVAPYYTFGYRTTTAPMYDPSQTYKSGDICMYGDPSVLYVNVIDIKTPEAWTPSHWELARGNYSVAEGGNSVAGGAYSHTEGYGCITAQPCCHAEGTHTIACGTDSHAEGRCTIASGLASHTQNYYTKASSHYQTALGKYNEEDTNSTYAIIVGNGTADNARSNALTVDWQGNVMAQGMAGQIIMYAGVAINSTDIDDHVTSTAPPGWLVCDGTPVLIDDYPELAAVLLINSTTTPPTYLYGGDLTHFNLPDFRGRVGVGVGESAATGHSAHTLGQMDGEEVVTLDATQIPAHTHGPGTLNITASGSHGHKLTYEKDTASGTARNRVVPGDDTGSSTGSNDATKPATHTHASSSFAGATAQNTGGDQAHNNMQPYIGINYIIATGKTY